MLKTQEVFIGSKSSFSQLMMLNGPCVILWIVEDKAYLVIYYQL